MNLRTPIPILLLMVAVLLPTAGVLWMMNTAIRNQRQNVRQTIRELYEGHLSLARQRIDSGWASKSAALERLPSGSVAFAKVIREGIADSAVILDSSDTPLYPTPLQLASPDPLSGDAQWLHAHEREGSSLSEASRAYEAIGAASRDKSIGARAYQAAIRCLMQSGDRESAIRLALAHFGGAELYTATDLQGRRIRADILLMVVSVDPHQVQAARALHGILEDYTSTIPGAQRVFVMRQMMALSLPPELRTFTTLEAEELAQRFLETAPKPVADETLRISSLPDVWQLGSRRSHVIALYRTPTVLSQTRKFLEGQQLPNGVHIDARPPGMRATNDRERLASAGARLPGWEIVLTQSGGDPTAELASRQMTLYLWIGSLLVLAVVALSVIAARAITRSLRLAGLKADLVATVSHELKTPLASMQLLVDTLLDDTAPDPQKTREYLEMMARENARLSQLITNFLTFSRMERNKYNLELAPVGAEHVIHAAVAAAGERFSEPGCHLGVVVEPNLPEIRADENAMVTALVNLLDNAYKYTQGEKRIELRAYAAEGGVCFEVRDNGIGIAPREISKIFRKFYQADKRLARTGGGCGLGLTIVRFLVEAHGGTVRVASEIGKGSTFTVALRSAA